MGSESLQKKSLCTQIYVFLLKKESKGDTLAVLNSIQVNKILLEDGFLFTFPTNKI